jgi:hypothetical protein
MFQIVAFTFTEEIERRLQAFELYYSREIQCPAASYSSSTNLNLNKKDRKPTMVTASGDKF